MTKRLLMLDDDQLERLLEWYDSAFGVEGGASRYVSENEDEELRDKIADSRLAA